MRRLEQIRPVQRIHEPAGLTRAPHPPNRNGGLGFELREVIALLRRQRRTILATAISLIIITLLVVSQLERRYQATALVVVDSQESQLLGFEPASQVFGLNPLVDTEVEIARSSSVLARVARRLSQPRLNELLPVPTIMDRFLSLIGVAKQSAVSDVSTSWNELPAGDQAEVIERLSKLFDITRVNLTKVISLSAEAKTPAEAADLANMLADAYLEEQIETRLNSSEMVVSLLRSRVDKLADEISRADDDIDRFVATTLSQYGTPESQALVRRLEEERAGHGQYMSTLMGLEAALQADDLNRISDLLGASASALVSRRKELVDLVTSSSSAQEDVQRARSDLAALDREIRAQAEQRAAEMRVALSNSEKNDTSLRSRLDSILARQEIPRDVSVTLFRMQRDAETKRNLYSSFLGKLRQAEQQAQIDLPDSRVIATARPSDKPSFPPYILIIGAAVLVSLGAGVGAGAVKENYLGGVTSAEQLEAVTGIPAIAAIPRFRSRHGSSIDSAISAESSSAFADAIRRVRFAIEALASAEQLSVFVTSTIPAEGKTTVALALARAFALTGKKTLLVDLDFRHPSVGEFTKGGADNFLVRYLTGMLPEGDVGLLASPPEEVTGLRLIVAHHDESRGATDALLMSERFRKLIDYARSNFDVVIMDTSPVGLFVDAQIVAREANLGLYVVRYGSTNQKALRAGLRELRTELPKLCTVLNQVEAVDGATGAYYRYHS